MVKNYIIFLIGILPIIYFFLNRKKENSKNDIEIHFNYLKEIKEVFKSEKIKEVIYILGNSGGDLDSIISSYMTSLGENINNNIIYFDENNNPKINKSTEKIYIPVINIKRGTYYERLEGKYIFNKFNINDEDFFYINDYELSNEYIIKTNKKISIILVDFSELEESQNYLLNYVEKVIDHHLQNISKFPNLKKRIIEYPIGSCMTLVLSHYFLNFFPEKIIPIQFAITPILIDCANFNKEYYGFKWDKFDLDIYNFIIKNTNLTSNDMTIYYNNIKNEMFNVENNLKLGFDILLRKDTKKYIWGKYYIKFIVFTISFENMYNYYKKEKMLELEKKFCYENIPKNSKCIVVCFTQNDFKYSFYTPDYQINDLINRINKIGDNIIFNIQKDNNYSNYILFESKKGITRKIIEPIFKKEFEKDE
jgi:inorganic pyrophosphatase/exopolyphosphatase